MDDKVTYASYLKVDALTSLQEPLSDPIAHDEMLFIITHQTYELWFKQILFEIGALIPAVESQEFLKSYKLLDRICEIFRVLIQQVDILETMTPVEFNRFRSRLNPASGFQSIQFRRLELIAGIDSAEYKKFLTLNPEWKKAIEADLAKPTLRTAFFSLLQKEKLLKSQTPETVQSAIRDIYYKPEHQTLHSLCEHLIRFDEQMSLWRFRHVQMVERMLGMRMGTGGSLGVPYLQQTLKKRFFPELWEARTHMNGSDY